MCQQVQSYGSPATQSSKTATNTVTVSAGWVTSGTNGTITMSAKSFSVTPTSLESNLIEGNIKSGISIFGVTGSYIGLSVIYSSNSYGTTMTIG